MRRPPFQLRSFAFAALTVTALTMSPVQADVDYKKYMIEADGASFEDTMRLRLLVGQVRASERLAGGDGLVANLASRLGLPEQDATELVTFARKWEKTHQSDNSGESTETTKTRKRLCRDFRKNGVMNLEEVQRVGEEEADRHRGEDKASLNRVMGQLSREGRSAVEEIFRKGGKRSASVRYDWAAIVRDHPDEAKKLLEKRCERYTRVEKLNNAGNAQPGP